MKVENVKPYATQECKSVQITRAFDVIAPTYDRLNLILSLGMDRLWRKWALSNIVSKNHLSLLDVATGTADFAILAAKARPDAQITGIDLSTKMLAIGRAKIKRAKLATRISLQTGDALSLPYPDQNFDVITCAFGARNFEHLDTGFRELRRVLKSGGQLIILELATPPRRFLSGLLLFYLRYILPKIGGILTGYTREYQYLPQSIQQVPQGDAMLALLRNAGFGDCRMQAYTLGVCICYIAFTSKGKN